MAPLESAQRNVLELLNCTLYKGNTMGLSESILIGQPISPTYLRVFENLTNRTLVIAPKPLLVAGGGFYWPIDDSNSQVNGWAGLNDLISLNKLFKLVICYARKHVLRNLPAFGQAKLLLRSAKSPKLVTVTVWDHGSQDAAQCTVVCNAKFLEINLQVRIDWTDFSET